MSFFVAKIKTEYETEYSDMTKNNEVRKAKYTKPKIYHGGKNYDLTKRWYVYFSYSHPDTGEMVRQSPIYLKLNQKYKTKTERLKAFKALRNVVERLLKKGYSPYKDIFIEEDLVSIKEALLYALDVKKQVVEPTTYRDYETKLSVFIKYLQSQGVALHPIEELTKRTVMDFLNQILRKSSPSTYNGYRRIISSLFTILEQEDIIKTNFIKSIAVLKSKPKKNKAYTSKEVDIILNHIQDKSLLLLIKFVSYNFLRPIEVCRLQVKDIDLKLKQLSVKTKTKALKTKRIPDIMVSELQKIDLSNPNAYLITAYGVAETNASATDRRNLFSKRYLKIKKELGFDNDYTIYSFRHTYITKLYRRLRKDFGKFEVYDKLMPITGHSTIKALEQYLRDIDAELAEDYSDLLR